MLSNAALAKNFRFMIVQVTRQLENTFKLMNAPNPRLIKAIQDSDDYIDSLKSMIENRCFSFLGDQKVQDERVVDTIRALNVITSNLERIADFSVNVARQVGRLRQPEFLRRFAYHAYFELLFEGVGLIDEALFQRDSSRALRICQIEDRVDRLYGADLGQILADLRAGRDVDQLITALFILHYLERMGDALLNVGEAIIFAVLGERLKIHQYRMLEEAIVSTNAVQPSIDNVEVAGIWGTRSGVRVGTVADHAPTDGSRKVLFKEGNAEKLEAERQSLERWEKLAPGLAPKVVEFQQQDRGAALLLQYLDGTTLQDLVLNADAEGLAHAQARIEETLDRVWRDTLVPEPIPGEYTLQLGRRSEDVFRVHPDLHSRAVRLGRVKIPAFEQLLERAVALEQRLVAPFRVIIHGDFNLDNIIYNREADTLHFVDLHRSRPMDYVQDVTVYAVSGFRLPVFVPRVRALIEATGQRMLNFARAFAAAHDDALVEPRLALGLARSLFTSVRFELNRAFAKSMFQRAEYLLARLTDHPDPNWQGFRVPDSVLVY